MFFVPRDTAGLTVGPRDKKMGQSGAWTADVYLDEVRVPGSALIGGTRAPGTRRRCAASRTAGCTSPRCASGWRSAWSTSRSPGPTTRQQGGGPIAGHQLVQAMLADSQTELMAGRGLVLEAARAFDAGEDTKMGPACAKYFCSEMVGRVADRAVQVHGGAGYMRGVPVERLYRDARLFRIYEGTSQIQQLVIARQLIRGRP